VTDYSDAPLAKKLGVKASSTVLVLHAPASFVLDVGQGVDVRRRALGHYDVVLAFFTESSSLHDQIEKLSQRVTTSGGLWIAWPKKASKMDTDMTDHVVRDFALPLGLVDNKVCAIDDTWTALRLVWRVSVRDVLNKK
jgi:hypothetical protein